MAGFIAALNSIDAQIIVAFITATGAGMVAFMEKFRRDSKSQKEQIAALREDTAATRYHVQNDHKTNLREDVDRVMEGVNRLIEGQGRHDAMLATQSVAIQSIRDDLRVERIERINLERRVDDIITGRPGGS